MTSPKSLGRLGFRDLELFNLALLAKQSWWLLQESMSLSVCILKADYYPATSILEAELGSNPSQIWRAILDGREVLKQCLSRRIGDGHSTEIWGCNWIPREPLLRPLIPLCAKPSYNGTRNNKPFRGDLEFKSYSASVLAHGR